MTYRLNLIYIDWAVGIASVNRDAVLRSVERSELKVTRSSYRMQ